eukprot:291009-Pelagomonas_calceolata.AAC.1
MGCSHFTDTVLLASGLLNPCPSRLERARSTVANLEQLFSIICFSIEFVFIAEASTGRASPGV